MRRILLITYTFPPDNVPAAARPGQLFKYLPECGYQCFVVAANDDGAAKDDDFVRRVPARDGSTAVELASAFARWFTRYCSPYEDRLRWVPYAAAAAADVIRRSQSKPSTLRRLFWPPTLPHSGSSFGMACPGLRTSRIPCATIRFAIAAGSIHTTRSSNYFFRCADRLIANTDTVARAWCNRYPKWVEKISVLWNSYDPLDGVELDEAPRNSHRVLAHVGSMYGGRHPGQLLASLERLNIEASTLNVKFVGPIDDDVLAVHGPSFERLKQKGVLAYGNRSVPRKEALQETADADSLLLLDINEKNASFQMPSKLLDYVRFGKPILAYTPADLPTDRS